MIHVLRYSNSKFQKTILGSLNVQRGIETVSGLADPASGHPDVRTGDGERERGLSLTSYRG